MPYAASRAGDLRIISKAQWDKEGQEGYEKRPAGTGSYRYVGRQPGLSVSFERVDNHWSREKPAFKELVFRLAREESTRLALLLSGEAHIADLPRELQKDALKRGMKIYSSSFPVDWMTVYLGGQYYLPSDPAFKADVAWTKKPVRQALNMAINRKELLNTVFAGKGTMTYVTGWSDKSEGYNPEWASRFDQMYGYDPGKAKALLKEAGYGPGQLKFKILAFTEPGESEGPQVAEALNIYYKDIGVETEIEVLDWAKVREMFRKKTIQCCIWPNIISWRPAEEWIRTSYYSKSPNHHYENEFIDKHYDALTKAVDPGRAAEDRANDRRPSVRGVRRHPALLVRQRGRRQPQGGGRVGLSGPGRRPLDTLPPSSSGRSRRAKGAAVPRTIGDVILEVEDLHTYCFTRWGVVKAVDGVSFSLRQGEALGIVGESGCGKTMTALSLLRLVPRPAARIVKGVIRLEGENLLEKSEQEMRSIRGRRISMILQDPQTSLNPVFTVGNQLVEAIRIHHRRRPAQRWRAGPSTASSRCGWPRPSAGCRTIRTRSAAG